MIIDPQKFDFESLRTEFAAPSSCTTIAYWIGVLTNTCSKISTDAEEACAVMSHQYDVEEQDNFCSFPEYIPTIFRPVAPVTLTLKWSPFPLALDVMGEPVTADAAKYGNRLFVFRPEKKKRIDPFGSADIRHFLFLLESAIQSTGPNEHILLCGSPGWSYTEPDHIYGSTRRLMKDFGFVYQRRKPKLSPWTRLTSYFKK
tara:strand:+ start:60 stop:662 length:603 start_codon:yes stop_codon:yes gene_type:complete